MGCSVSQNPVREKYSNIIIKAILLLYEGCYYTETSPLICRANQWTGFYMITASVMKELKWMKFIADYSTKAGHISHEDEI